MKKNSFILGVIYILFAFFISALNDVISKTVGFRLGGVNILFFRFLFGALMFLPWIFWNPALFKTRHLKIHAIRGGGFALAMLPWSYGLIALPLPLLTTIGFTMPLFVTLLAFLFLRENIGWKRLAITSVGFLGILVSTGFSFKGGNLWVTLALVATLLFAGLDILNKRLLSVDEKLVPMMFFSSMWSTLFVAPLVLWQWQTPSIQEILVLVLLGIGSNAFLACLLKAYGLCDISFLQPFRYFEFVFSCIMSFLFFQEVPTTNVILGLCIIIPSTLYLSYSSIRQKNHGVQQAENLEPF